jgi:hypothetical protein
MKELERHNRSLELELGSNEVLELGSNEVLELDSMLVLELGSSEVLELDSKLEPELGSTLVLELGSKLVQEHSNRWPSLHGAWRAIRRRCIPNPCLREAWPKGLVDRRNLPLQRTRS